MLCWQHISVCLWGMGKSEKKKWVNFKITQMIWRSATMKPFLWWSFRFLKILDYANFVLIHPQGFLVNISFWKWAPRPNLHADVTAMVVFLCWQWLFINILPFCCCRSQWCNDRPEQIFVKIFPYEDSKSVPIASDILSLVNSQRKWCREDNVFLTLWEQI